MIGETSVKAKSTTVSGIVHADLKTLSDRFEVSKGGYEHHYIQIRLDGETVCVAVEDYADTRWLKSVTMPYEEFYAKIKEAFFKGA